MSMSLMESSYGKSHVRLTKVTRHGQRHDLKEITVSVLLQGEFERSYTEGDNSQLIATDTIKNTVYALGARHPLSNIESFGIFVGEHFLSRNKHVSSVSVEISQDRWERIETDGQLHPHAFVSGSKDTRTTCVQLQRDATRIESGIDDLCVLKTANSAFSGFIRDEYTTLKDTDQRIFATSIVARWLYKRPDTDFDKNFDGIRRMLLDVFAAHSSLSVQQTLFEMGERVLETFDDIEEISLTMPNQHRLLVDLSRFNVPNDNEIFVATDEPYGLICAKVGRSNGQAKGDKTAELSARQ